MQIPCTVHGVYKDSLWTPCTHVAQCNCLSRLDIGGMGRKTPDGTSGDLQGAGVSGVEDLGGPEPGRVLYGYTVGMFLSQPLPMAGNTCHNPLFAQYSMKPVVYIIPTVFVYLY
jgi:hypothetical protein